MSLIVDINPVPWKILDLVRARIIKNRAKKSKKGMDWSGEALTREMSVQPGLLTKKRKDEPSFTLSESMHYSISIIDEDNDYISLATSNLQWQQWSNKNTFKFINKNNNLPYEYEAQARDGKRFILIIPESTFYPSKIQFYPSTWPNLADPEGEPVGVSFSVARYDEVSAIQPPSDYFRLIEEATNVPWSDVASVYVSLDNSGSMGRGSVAPDLDLFLNKLKDLNIAFSENRMPNSNTEQWIYPHTIDP